MTRMIDKETRNVAMNTERKHANESRDTREGNGHILR